ncbi:hypothetical protein [Shewanella woodyi]|uniref:hypothetical protein n=1 Tax=Shewanella woodyi TaxID=60961 RepID=UPI0007F93021|nr:hypothetical protein [Shewanella woodyi]
MVNGMKISTITLCFMLLSSSTSASELSDDPLVKRCLGIFEIYKNNDLDAFLNEFSNEWIALFDQQTFKKQLNKKHNKFKSDYNYTPKEILVKGI